MFCDELLAEFFYFNSGLHEIVVAPSPSCAYVSVGGCACHVDVTPAVRSVHNVLALCLCACGCVCLCVCVCVRVSVCHDGMRAHGCEQLRAPGGFRGGACGDPTCASPPVGVRSAGIKFGPVGRRLPRNFVAISHQGGQRRPARLGGAPRLTYAKLLHTYSGG